MQRRQNLQQIIARSEAELYALQHFTSPFSGGGLLDLAACRGKTLNRLNDVVHLSNSSNCHEKLL